uniref:Putative polyprotein n=1 Tax=Albugo laibachii Nc14 TaxID=890382 RepID=F0WCF1_9STRA|nr:putative polyprotein [Albugo laibachii Nc14]|eukprot:CCA18866.1 putative polyprotein [Albugo laibachii Nc14]
MISPNLQYMVRSACSATQPWDILKNFFLEWSMHNRIRKKRELHEFKMKKGGSGMDDLLRFDELCISMQAFGASIYLDDQLLVLLGSMSEDFDQIINIMVNVPGMDMFQVEEMLLRESEGISAKEKHGMAPKAQYKRQSKGRANRPNRNTAHFEGKCFRCNKYGHKQADCWKSNKAESEEAHAFTAFQESQKNWILDSGASSHVCPNKSEFTDLQALKKKIPISIANGSKVDAVGVGTIFARFKNTRNLELMMFYVPGLDRKLLSVSALAENGLQVVFRNLTCEIKSDDRSIVEIQRIGKLFVFKCETLEVAHFGGEAGRNEDVPVD